MAALHGKALHGGQCILQLADEGLHVGAAAPVRHQRHRREGPQALQQLAGVLVRQVLPCIGPRALSTCNGG